MRSTKQLLSPHLYKEGLHQLRVAGLIAAVLSAGYPLIELIMTLVSVLTKTGNPKMAPSDITAISSLTFVVVGVFAAIAVFSLFGFLNKRGSSDFYHALPVSRMTLYFSFLAAILTWVWGIGLLALLLVVAVVLVCAAPLTFAMAAVSFGLLLSAVLFVVAAALVAVTITGTRFMNLLVMALIVLVPNAIAGAFSQAVAGRAPSLPVEFAGVIGTVSLHNTLFMLTSDTTLYGSVSFVASIVVTTLWSLVLICVGARFFRRRLSELAGTITLSRGFLSAFRVALAVLVVALVVASLSGGFSGRTTGFVMSSGSSGPPASFATLLRTLIPILALILVAFVGIELLATRKLKHPWRALPSFGVVLAFAAAFSGAIFLYSASARRFAPAADQIASVQIITSNYDVITSSSSPVFTTLFSSADSPASFNDILTQRIAYNDPALLQATAVKLRESVSVNDFLNTNGDPALRLIVVRMKGGGSAYRLINISGGSNPDAFDRALVNSREAAKTLLALPDPDTQMRFSGSAFPLSSGDTSALNFVSTAPQQYFVSSVQQERAYRSLYGLFYTEYQKLSPEEQYQALYEDQSSDQAAASTETTGVAGFIGKGLITVDGGLGAQQFSNTYNLGTTKTLLRYWEMNCLDITTALTKAPSRVHLDELDLWTPSALYSLSYDATSSASFDPFWAVKSARFVAAVQNGGATITVTESNGSGTISADDDPAEKEISNTLMQQAEAIIKPALSRPFNLDAPVFAALGVNYYDTSNRNQLAQSSITVPLTAQEAAALQALTKD
ncbi:MAG: hypothetical protein FWD65_03415 [Coriobacteriia bacterium]|nr:hypothetical protein [Coriobacteriia bacterium]